MSDELKLIAPTVELEESYRSYVAEVREADALFVPWVLGFNADEFPALIARLHEASEGRGIPKTFVPHTTFWTIDASGQIIGVANIRHELNENLLLEGGHIGYSIRPSLRGRGLATRQLALAVAEAGRRGIQRVLVVCERDNSASARVIAKNGGRLAGEVTSEETGKMMQRYWIEL
ncbi:MAG: GNAT family N-acetyltransferase [Phycisphaerae bacterium]|jgi:predicted acetyltransferase|nr:GNAT family N-acetyltransferase [Phycisphaerae bacterium]